MVENNGLNYQEGMFLGKQELDRQQTCYALVNAFFIQAFGLMKDGDWEFRGLLDPRITDLGIASREVDGVNGVAVGFGLSGNPLPNGIGIWGRSIVGVYPKGIGQWCGAVELAQSTWTGKEGWLSIADKSDGDWYVRVSPGMTHYENALITINSNGTGRITKGSGRVDALNSIRNTGYGRQTIIKTEQNDVLVISSYDKSTGVITFAGDPGSFAVRTNVKFAFVSTVNPFSNDLPGYLYSYPTMIVSLTANDTETVETSILGKITISSGSITDIVVFNTSYQANKYKFLGYRELEDGMITTDKLADGAVTEAKIANNAITENKLGDGAVIPTKIFDNAIITRKIMNGAVTSEKLGTDAVETVKIKNEAVTSPKIAPNAITDEKILDDAVRTRHIKDGEIVGSKINDGAITSTKLARFSVESTKIASGAVSSTKLASILLPNGIFGTTIVVDASSSPRTISVTEICGERPVTSNTGLMFWGIHPIEVQESCNLHVTNSFSSDLISILPLKFTVWVSLNKHTTMKVNYQTVCATGDAPGNFCVEFFRSPGETSYAAWGYQVRAAVN